MDFESLSVANVIFREIGKSANKDDAVYQGNEVTQVRPGQSVASIVAGHAKKSSPAGGGHWPNQKNTQLSIEVTAGNNLYLVKLDPATRAAFGPNPIMILPCGFASDLLADIGLVYLNSADQPIFLPAHDIRNHPVDLRRDAMLSFTCDRAKLEELWKSVMPSGHQGIPVSIPFYLNLYDTATNAPVWTFQPYSKPLHHHPDPSKQVETHGGIHPSHDPHGDEPIHFVTHGGIHPGSPSQSLY